MHSSKQFALLLTCFVVVSTLAQSAVRPGDKQSDYAAERSARAAQLTQPFGWLSLTALEWLKPGVTTVGSAPDNSVVLADAPAHLVTFEQKDGKVIVTADSPSLLSHGQHLIASGPQAVIGSGEDNGSALASGTLRLWVIDRGGQRYLRVKNSRSPTLKHFHGLRWYPSNEHYRVEARWIPSSPPYEMHVLNKIGEISLVKVPGRVEFTLDGTKQTLVPMEAGNNGLWFVFRDMTSRQTTDGGGRFLTTQGPSNGLDHPGTVILDFNQAVNPPCAYTPFATCPLAPKEDRLPIAIPAGEKRYDE